MSELNQKITAHLVSKKSIWMTMNDGNILHINKYNFIGIIPDPHGDWVEINEGKSSGETTLYNLKNCKSIKFD
jgi:hypothetical protein